MIDQNAMISIAKSTARLQQVDPALLCALFEHESSWNPYAIRYEPAFFARYIHPALPDRPTTEDMNRAQSFGLGQLMGETARELGFKGKYLSELCDPVTGAVWACKKLAFCLKSENGDIAKSLLRYNGGGDPSYPGLVMPLMVKYQDATQGQSV